MRKRKYLIGATLGVLGALIVSSNAFAGVPTGQTLNATIAPAKQQKKTFGAASLHNIIITTYDNFSQSPAAKETLFHIDRNVHFVNGSIPACPKASLDSATTTAAVQAACGASIVGTGTNTVNNGTTPLFPGTNPVLLVSGGNISGGSILYVWTRIANTTTLNLVGTYNTSAGTLDVTGLPNTSGIDLTNFDTTMPKLKSGKKTFYVMARCKKGKWKSSETTTYWNGQQITANSPPQKCKQKKAKK